jgi:uncharacterized protein DUF4388
MRRSPGLPPEAALTLLPHAAIIARYSVRALRNSGTAENLDAPATVAHPGFGGRLRALSVADVLNFVRALNRTGLLSFSSDGVRVGLHLSEGRVVHASSSRESDRLTDLLVRWGILSPAQHEETIRRAAAGERIGKALVASGAVTPRGLMEARARQVKQIALSLFDWTSGEFVLLEDERPPDGSVLVDLPALDLIVEGIRSLRTPALFRERLPSPDWIFEALPHEDRKIVVTLEPHEESILRLVDGSRTVSSLTALAEFPDLETLRVLFLLVSIGFVKIKPQSTGDVDEEEGAEPVERVVERYNAMIGRVYQYLTREIGPLSAPLLGKSLQALKGIHPVLFSRASLGGDGTIDGEILRENLHGLSDRRRRETLVQGLNELLYSELLVLRRTLGVEHENRVLRAIHPEPLRVTVGGGHV